MASQKRQKHRSRKAASKVDAERRLVDAVEALRDLGLVPRSKALDHARVGVCEMCGEPFVDRSHGEQRRTCSGRCRQRLHRRRKIAREAAVRAAS